jgi:hypothetical protein
MDIEDPERYVRPVSLIMSEHIQRSKTMMSTFMD